MRKDPSIAETLDWANSLLQLSADAFSEKLIDDTLNLLLKDEEDYEEFASGGGSRSMLRTMMKNQETEVDEDLEEMRRAERYSAHGIGR